jgi:hypothetical protein
MAGHLCRFDAGQGAYGAGRPESKRPKRLIKPWICWATCSGLVWVYHTPYTGRPLNGHQRRPSALFQLLLHDLVERS